LNEAELVDELRSLAEVDLIYFTGMSFHDQATHSFLVLSQFFLDVTDL